MPDTLLLADDSATIQRVIEMTFAEEDVRVVAVGDGREAMERIAADPPDIVLADTHMPEKDGYDVSAFVKADRALSHIPVVLLTRAFDPVDDARAREVGCDAVLVKPLEPKAVLDRVRELLGTPADSGAAGAPAVPRPEPAAANAAPETLSSEAAPDAPSSEAAPPPSEAPSPEAAPPPPASAAAAPPPSDAPSPEAAPPPASAAAAPPPATAAAPAARAAAPKAPAPDAAPPPVSAGAAAPSPGAVAPAVPPSPSGGGDGPAGPDPAPAADSAGVPPPSPAVPAVEAPPPPSLADAFASLLAAEQGDVDRARAAWPWARRGAPAGEDDLIERVAERVVERLSDDVTGELVSEVVARVAERMVRDQIGRIEPA